MNKKKKKDKIPMCDPVHMQHGESDRNVDHPLADQLKGNGHILV